MKEEYEVHYRDARDVVLSMVSNPEFADEIDFGPFQERDEDGAPYLDWFTTISRCSWYGAGMVWVRHRVSCNRLRRRPSLMSAAFPL